MLRAEPCAPHCVDAMCELFAESLSDTDEDISHQNLSNALLRIVTSFYIGQHAGIVHDRGRAGSIEFVMPLCRGLPVR